MDPLGEQGQGRGRAGPEDELVHVVPAGEPQGIHLHTLACPDEACFRRVREALARAGFLLAL